MIYLDGDTELTNLTIGENVTVVIDVGQDLDDSTSLAIKTCTLSSNGNSIDFIENGLVPSYFTQMVVPLNSTLNREAKFNWKVFQVGNLATSTLSCKIELIIDHCLSGDFQCEENSFCINNIGNYSCVCNDGFERSEEEGSCTDVDECLRTCIIRSFLEV